LSPSLPISPTIIHVRASQKSDLGKVIYGNSITLTPGTVAIDIDGDKIEVHALTREAAQALRDGDMDRRVTRLEGVE
jgi:multicomponent Na+:H+ antiporter subunit E